MIRTVKYAAAAVLLTLGAAVPATASTAARTTPAAPVQAALLAAETGPFTLRAQVQPLTCVDGNADRLLYACNRSDVQKWTIRDNNNEGDGDVALVYKRGGTCLETDYHLGIELRECGYSESWKMTKVAGGYQFHDISTKVCLGVDTERFWGNDVPVKLRVFKSCAPNKWNTWLVG